MTSTLRLRLRLRHIDRRRRRGATLAFVVALVLAVISVLAVVAPVAVAAGSETDALATGASEAAAEDGAPGLVETLTLGNAQDLGTPLRGLLLVTILSVVPSAILLMTCFPRVVIVLSFLRRALGTQELPPNLVVFGLSLLITGAVMLPVWKEVWREAWVPLVERGEIDGEEALRRAEAPIKRFMLGHVCQNDRESLRFFYRVSKSGEEAAGAESAPPTTLEDLDFFVVLPAFVSSELETAFRMGFYIFLPFVLIDLVVSAVLVSMGMFMLPPNLVSLPLKILVFVLVDGWSLVVTQLATSLTVS